METINRRRSIRKYRSEPVERERVEALLRAAMQAPSAGNQRPWEFLVVENRDRLKALAGMSAYAGMVAHAAGAVVFLGCAERMRFPENWEQDMAAAAQNFLLEAVEQGLGAVWLGVAPVEDRELYVRELFDLPEGYRPFCVIPFGVPGEGQENVFTDRFEAERIHFERLG